MGGRVEEEGGRGVEEEESESTVRVNQLKICPLVGTSHGSI